MPTVAVDCAGHFAGLLRHFQTFLGPLLGKWRHLRTCACRSFPHPMRTHKARQAGTAGTALHLQPPKGAGAIASKHCHLQLFGVLEKVVCAFLSSLIGSCLSCLSFPFTGRACDGSPTFAHRSCPINSSCTRTLRTHYALHAPVHTPHMLQEALFAL